MKKYIPSALGTLLFPLSSYAQSSETFKGIAGEGLNVLTRLMQTVFVLFSFGIIYTTFRYITALREGKGAEEMRSRLLWAVVGMAVVFSLWAIIYLFANTLGWTASVGIPAFSRPK